jgi:organic radical activating enzyme
MEHFYTIQGEGYFQGQAAYFIRLGGCDVGCVWCDVKDSWDASRWPSMTPGQMVQQVKAFPKVKIVVITGGEPAMYNCTPITDALHNAGYRTHIETSGAYPITGDWDWVCLSPKKFKAPLPKNQALVDELKVVIYHKSDFEWAEKHTSGLKNEARLYLQPEWSRYDTIAPLIVDYVKANPKWAISLQIHKYLGVD